MLWKALLAAVTACNVWHLPARRYLSGEGCTHGRGDTTHLCTQPTGPGSCKTIKQHFNRRQEWCQQAVQHGTKAALLRVTSLQGPLLAGAAGSQRGIHSCLQHSPHLSPRHFTKS